MTPRRFGASEGVMVYLFTDMLKPSAQLRLGAAGHPTGYRCWLQVQKAPTPGWFYKLPLPPCQATSLKSLLTHTA